MLFSEIKSTGKLSNVLLERFINSLDVWRAWLFSGFVRYSLRVLYEFPCFLYGCFERRKRKVNQEKIEVLLGYWGMVVV